MRMRMLVRVCIISFLIFVLMIFSHSTPEDENEPIKDQNSATPPKIDYSIQDDQKEETTRPDEGLSVYIGKNSETLIKDYGKPQRIDPSAYGYDWWIYKNFAGTYMQVGVSQKKVVTIYALGNQLNVSPYTIGQSVADIFRSTIMEAEITISTDEGAYRFELSEEDLNLRPLVPLGNIFAQLSIDKYTGTLTSIRFFDTKTLITQKPYELLYNGHLLEPENPGREEWKEIEEGSKQQIFDITNIIRERFDLITLKWDETVSAVAYNHSQDMANHEYFSHDSPEYGSLAERLDAQGIEYDAAAENIAKDYIDGPAAVEAWLNVEGHRKTLLDKDYTNLGVGVFQKYYTQNFIKTE
ncbi:CAP domain-containing protein [Lederbergia sp. NSJ-179]|uniref:CAP domain-containing protein n=1 Tax=Lederbergia sp. NSJ-179 TaxID=2931402 RepID=UPI001FD311E8|nr:CAP domain-containing protein [Lederbergia sp. NSJ-179]MCJ7839526.1 CAP domain-containing protein [Lederbergia sp. NSJ-179]